MTTNHMVLWIDHREAKAFHFNPESSTEETIRTQDSHRHLHHKRGSIGSGNAPEDRQFLEAACAALQGTPEVLILGPGSAKLELVKYLHRHHPELVDHVIGVETVDHPTDRQVVAFAREYFRRADRMLGT